MRLSELLNDFPTLSRNFPESLEVSSLCYDSRKICEGALFFAVRGGKSDGHDYLREAAEKGAAAAVVEDPSAVPEAFPFVHVRDVRSCMAKAAAIWYGDETASLPLFGVTGTNGKTTTTYLLESILSASGFHPAVLGTVSYRYGDLALDASHTTPESVELQEDFRKLREYGADSFVMEVSSHSLEQHRADGCHFDVAIFTNLTRDHLDYHKTMENYLKSKKRLFTELLSEEYGKGVRSSVINIDDPASEELLSEISSPVMTYGMKPGADVTAESVEFSTKGVKGVIKAPSGEIPFESPLIGSYNLSNILAAAAGGIAFGLSLDSISQGISSCRKVPGRVEPVENRLGITVLVDYAHTGDALENVLKTLSSLKENRIITVFGCGGDRDRGKRPIMGGVAAKYSDLAVVTSDNPRTENPDFIISEIVGGIEPLGIQRFQTEDPSLCSLRGKGYSVEPDRRKAIRGAVKAACAGDIILIAGKGHEDYQIVGTVKHHFDDREEALEALKMKAGEP